MGYLSRSFKNISQVSAQEDPVMNVGLLQSCCIGWQRCVYRFFPQDNLSCLVFFLLICLFFIADFSTLVFCNPFFYYDQLFFLPPPTSYSSISFLSHPLLAFLSTVAIESCVCLHRSLSDYLFPLSLYSLLYLDIPCQYSSDYESPSWNLLQIWPGLVYYWGSSWIQSLNVLILCIFSYCHMYFHFF